VLDPASRSPVARPVGEELPLVLWLGADLPHAASAALGLGAAVVSGTVPSPSDGAATGDDPARAMDDLASEFRARFGRCYALHASLDGAPGLRAGIRGTRLHDADPWAVALVLGALRDAGARLSVDADARGGGTTDELQGFTLRLAAPQADCIAAAIAALADGLRVSKC
jgi:hypothetical protein